MTQVVSASEVAAGAQLLTTSDVADMLQVSERTVETWRYVGEGPAFVKVGRLVRYRLVDVQRFVSLNRELPRRLMR